MRSLRNSNIILKHHQSQGIRSLCSSVVALTLDRHVMSRELEGLQKDRPLLESKVQQSKEQNLELERLRKENAALKADVSTLRQREQMLAMRNMRLKKAALVVCTCKAIESGCVREVQDPNSIGRGSKRLSRNTQNQLEKQDDHTDRADLMKVRSIFLVFCVCLVHHPT